MGLASEMYIVHYFYWTTITIISSTKRNSLQTKPLCCVHLRVRHLKRYLFTAMSLTCIYSVWPYYHPRL